MGCTYRGFRAVSGHLQIIRLDLISKSLQLVLALYISKLYGGNSIAAYYSGGMAVGKLVSQMKLLEVKSTLLAEK